ncbi:MAG: hypothetical protein KDE58_34445, partial [Caldilineaceae bacterium]|nr:hypothetical protein [Caldilineaceae bacterium]
MRTRTAMIFTVVISAIVMFGLGYLFGDRLGLSTEPDSTPTPTTAVLSGGAVEPTFTATTTASPSPTVDLAATENAMRATIIADFNATIAAQPPTNTPTAAPSTSNATPVPITRAPTETATPDSPALTATAQGI